MKINDLIYGETQIKEKVLIDIIKTPSMQRLKDINQGGVSVHSLRGQIATRYPHSIGTMILLKNLGASIEEQISGLIHDVSHTAFSHVIDFVYPNKNHTVHEKFKHGFLEKSKIPQIIKSHGFDPEFVMDEENFPLLERSIPDLCADRVDYTFRDSAVYFGKIKQARNLSKKLTVKNNEIVFSDFDSALSFGKMYLFADENAWAYPESIVLAKITAQAIKEAVSKGIMTEDDFFKTDTEVMQILEDSDDEIIFSLLSKLKPNIRLEKSHKGYPVTTKYRYTDPKFLEDGKLKRVSEVSDEFKTLLKQHEKWSKKVWNAKVL